MRKHLFTTIAFIVFTVSANAQTGAGALFSKEIKLFDFPLNTKRLEAGFNAGQAGSFSEYARFGMGANILAGGVYLDFIHADPQHRFDGHISDTQWNDTEAFSINAGYQIPVLSWLRIMPLVGYAQTNEGITDGSSWKESAGDDYSSSWYHSYKVTPGTRAHYFNYGGGLSIQPCKWFSINLIGTCHAIYGGIGFDILSFARR